MPQFLRIEACSIASISPFNRASSAAVCLSPCTKNAAGQKMMTAAVVATVSVGISLHPRPSLQAQAGALSNAQHEQRHNADDGE
jgi:hypothetical protein